MIRERMQYSPILSVVAACVSLFLAACNQSAPAPDPGAPPAATAPSPGVTPAAIPGTTRGPTVLTEIDEAASSAKAADSGLCSFDKVNGQSPADGSVIAVPDPEGFFVSGWIGDKATMTRPPANLRITQVESGRSWEIAVGPPLGRGDVARHFDSEGLSEAGFEVAADLSALPPGEYGLSLFHERGGAKFNCDKGARVRIEY